MLLLLYCCCCCCCCCSYFVILLISEFCCLASFQVYFGPLFFLVVEWTHLDNMSLNLSKTNYMILMTRQKRQLLHSPSAHLSVGNQQITEVSDHKVLDVTMNNLTWAPTFATCAKLRGEGGGESTNQQKIFIFLTFIPVTSFSTHIFSPV